MVMNLWSKSGKTSSGSSDAPGCVSNSTNATQSPESVVTGSQGEDNQSQVMDNRLAKLAQVQDGWRKQVYLQFRTGAHVPWDSFREDFKNMTWARKYLNEGSGTHVSGNIISEVKILCPLVFLRN